MLFEKIEKINPWSFTLGRGLRGWTWSYTMKFPGGEWSPTQTCATHHETAQQALEHAIRCLEKEKSDV